MYAIFILLVLAATWVLWRSINRHLYNDAFSPFNLLFYFWIAPFGLSLSELSTLQSGIEANALAARPESPMGHHKHAPTS